MGSEQCRVAIPPRQTHPISWQRRKYTLTLHTSTQATLTLHTSTQATLTLRTHHSIRTYFAYLPLNTHGLLTLHAHHLQLRESFSEDGKSSMEGLSAGGTTCGLGTALLQERQVAVVCSGM